MFTDGSPRPPQAHVAARGSARPPARVRSASAVQQPAVNQQRTNAPATARAFDPDTYCHCAFLNADVRTSREAFSAQHPVRHTAPRSRRTGRESASPHVPGRDFGWRCGWSVALRGPCGVAHEVPADRCRSRIWLSIEERPVGISPRCGSKEERARSTRSRSALRGSHQMRPRRYP